MWKIFNIGIWIVVVFVLGYLVGVRVESHYGTNITRIAPTYALDNQRATSSATGKFCLEPLPLTQNFDDFWHEATKNTEFTIDGKPVEITDIQVFYKTNATRTKCFDLSKQPLDIPLTKDNGFYFTTFDDITYLCTGIKDYIYGNITYYPLGIENSQTYVVPTPTPVLCDWRTELCCYFAYPTPTPMPTPTPNKLLNCGNITYGFAWGNTTWALPFVSKEWCGYLNDCSEQCAPSCHICSYFDSDYDGLGEGHCLDPIVPTPTPIQQ